jgi:LmbE family N-acetylglucosaminyl deacetylase
VTHFSRVPQVRSVNLGLTATLRQLAKNAAVISRVLALVAFSATAALAQFSPAPGTGPGLPETVEAIDSARITTRILYVTAHPDDESSSVLTYLARGLHADVALLSLTRGEGGQNALGPEQAPQLGLIRTQELLAATRGYGVKLFFTRARDFGFSKTPEETEKIWGNQVLDDMVRVIRTYRPNIVINNWGGVHTGHGHHQASGILTPQAVAAAADPRQFPDQGLPAWNGLNVPVRIIEMERGSEHPTGYVLPLDEISPLWGKTWREIGIDAFANHRTQGITVFLGSPFILRPIALRPEGGGTLDPAIFARPLHELDSGATSTGCDRTAFFCPVLLEAEHHLDSADSSALSLHWKDAAQHLAAAAQNVTSLFPGGAHAAHWRANDPLLDELHLIQQRIENALALVGGVEVRAQADRSDLVRGESFQIKASAHCRPETDCVLGEPQLLLSQDMSEAKKEGGAAKGYQFTVNVGPATNEAHAALPLVSGLNHSVWNQLLPEPPPLVSLQQKLTIAGYSFAVSEPVTHIEANSTRVDRVPVRIVPAYTLTVEPRQAIALISKPAEPVDIFVRVHSYSTKPGTVRVSLNPPREPKLDWRVSSGDAHLTFDGTGDRYAKVTVQPPPNLPPGNYALSPYATDDKQAFSISIDPLPSSPTILWQEPAQCLVHAFDINVPAHLRVGYIAAEGEPIPDDLRMLGIDVELLDAEALAFGDLSRFDAIVTGVRAYELRSDLPGANQRLLDYVARGGTLIVQYNRDFAWENKPYAPYPAKIGNPTPRITDENSPVKFLKPDDPLLNKPNKITQADFQGWLQERGLYFWKDFDSKYTPLLAMNDPGESDLNGSLVYTKLGKGTYIYTGLAFFRQLPEGVSGAYRLFINLLSASR